MPDAPITQDAIAGAFSELFQEFEDADNWLTLATRPLMAHYTSVDTLRKILEFEELWLSNPMFMNDLEELRWGFQKGRDQFFDTVTTIFGTTPRANILLQAFNRYWNEFDAKHALDVYVFCLSDHEAGNTDGKLSMWRAYGNQGNGAAIVFRIDKVQPEDGSPLIFAKVRYASEADRQKWLQAKIERMCKIVEDRNIPDDKLSVAAFYMLEVIKLFAVSWKHAGFLEEKEWRVIYLPDRDTSGLLKDRFGYVIGPRGVEPKLKLKIAPLAGVLSPTITLAQLVDSILLGPSLSSWSCPCLTGHSAIALGL